MNPIPSAVPSAVAKLNITYTYEMKSRDGKSQREEKSRGEESRRKIREEKDRVRRKKMQMREKVDKSRNTVGFSNDLWLRRVEK